MNDIARETLPANLEQEMRQSYLDYAMSVIVGRALPDVRDGLKPVHRRVLYAMTELGNDWNRPYKKSARVVGDVIGKYHPHGDSAVYDTIVRMAQHFSLRYPLIDGQGNFGSVDGDAPAAMRYTEIRLARIAHELLEDLDKDTVDFVANYDDTEQQPLLLPARLPNLLINGASGIAVGMATNMPPHNLSEVINACLAFIENENLSARELMAYLPGPDFPTAGLINGGRGILEAYQTGRGKIYVRARAQIEETAESRSPSIVVTELPYQVNKARLLEKIAILVRGKKLEGITGLRDESDKHGMRVVIELRRGETPDVVLNNLYRHTQMETVFGINLVALTGNQPRLFTLPELLQEFLEHRREVITRRTLYDLGKARSRAHVLEGLAVALSNIDEVIALIKASTSPHDARAQLILRAWQPGVVLSMLDDDDAALYRPLETDPAAGFDGDVYRLTDAQAQAILDLRLHRLTSLEQDKIHSEYQEILDRIRNLLDILSSGDRLTTVIKEELQDIAARYGDDRRTEIIDAQIDLSDEDLIPVEDLVITLSHAEYVKCQPLGDYQAQRRGGRGRVAARTKEDDFIRSMFVANSHDTLLCFSNLGKVYWLKVYRLPQAGSQARGRPLVNLLPLDENEKITAFLRQNGTAEENHFVVMATQKGTIKKTPASSFARARSTGLRAIQLTDGDELVDVAITSGHAEIVLVSSAGKAIRFPESNVRDMGRVARGVRGISLKSRQWVVSMMVIEEHDQDKDILIASAFGNGKRTRTQDFPIRRRGGVGVIAIKDGERNGETVGARQVEVGDQIALITDSGRLVRTDVSGVSQLGRNTQGVRLITLGEGEVLAGIERIDEAMRLENPDNSSVGIEPEG
ncbi:MAG: DNA gyrase subunit A [Pseudomonadota bacterium]|nr:DNA gyrase subunit A [Pseudomonadota bacterium]